MTVFKHRVSPHSTTGVSPSEHMGYIFRSRMDSIFLTQQGSKRTNNTSKRNVIKQLCTLSVGYLVYAKSFHIHLTWMAGKIATISGLIFYVILGYTGYEIADMFHIEVEGFNLVQVLYHWSTT